MAGPWEAYQSASSAGPWTQYAPSVGSQLAASVTDIPSEIGGALKENLGAINDNLNPVSDARRTQTEAAANAPSYLDTLGSIAQQTLGVGKGLAAIPGTIAAPITGAARSLLGHPLAVATGLPYEEAKGKVDTAMMALAPRGASPLGLRSTPAPIPSVAELKADARASYQAPEVKAVKIDPQSTTTLAAKIESDLTQQGFRPKDKQGGATFSEIRDLAAPKGVTTVGIDDIRSARRALGNLAKEKDAVGQPTTEAAAATIAKKHLDDYLVNLSTPDLLAGDIQKAGALLKSADSNWKAAKNSESASLQLTRAERQAARSGTGSNIENAMRQKISAILDNPKRAAQFSPEAIAKMEEIVAGTIPRNVLRKAGKLGVDGGLSLLLHGGALWQSGGMSLPVAIGGTVARKVGEGLTAKAGRALDELIRSQSALSRSRPAVNVPLPNGLLGAIPAAQIGGPQLGGLLGQLQGLSAVRADEKKKK